MIKVAERVCASSFEIEVISEISPLVVSLTYWPDTITILACEQLITVTEFKLAQNCKTLQFPTS